MPTVHPTAIVDPAAQLADSVQIGPYCVISGPARLGDGVRLIANVHLNGPVRIGAGTILYPFVCVGFEPQDYKFKPGSVSAGVTIGAGCLLREHATVHAASNDHTPTSLGDRVFMMTSSHAGHDCKVGSDVVMVSGALLGGHAVVQDRVTLGGGCLVHQHTRVGRLAMMGGGVPISADLPPFCLAHAPNRIGGINVIGLRRNGFHAHDIGALREVVGSLLRLGLPKAELLARLDERSEDSPAVAEFRAFVAESKRPICSINDKRVRGSIREHGLGDD
jgi:UDP-N-acetylglucosamine acyltransferase